VTKTYIVFTTELAEDNRSFEGFHDAERYAREMSESVVDGKVHITAILDEDGVVHSRYLYGHRIKDSGYPVHD